MQRHEEERIKEAQRILAEVRLGYAVFCAVVLVTFRKTFGVPEAVPVILARSGVFYSVLRIGRPGSCRPARLPPWLDWFDWVFIALLVFCTGGARSCFHPSYVLPISGGALRYGPTGGFVGAIIASSIAAASFLFPQGPLYPAWLYMLSGAMVMYWLAFIAGATSQRENAVRAKLYHASMTDH